MFTTAALPLGARWAIKGRTWTLVQRSGVSDTRWRLHLCDPGSGMLAVADVGRVFEGLGPSIAPPPRETTIQSPTDGWPGYAADDFSIGENLAIAGVRLVVFGCTPRGDQLDVALETRDLCSLRFRARAAERRGDYEKASSLLYGDIPRREKMEVVRLHLPLRVEAV